ESMSVIAEHWLRDLIDIERDRNTGLPHPVYAIAARARSIHEEDAGRPRPMARARVPTRSGQWLVVHAVRMVGAAGGQNPLILEPAPSLEIAPLIIRAYGLSPRP